jgi:peptidoglycan/LPS O-acetylase OafA/YrhL
MLEPGFQTFASAYRREANNFDFLRFVLASLVIWSHSFPLSGRGMDWCYASSGQIDAGSLAVDGFFVLSGFLVTQSWLSCPNIWIFGRKRLLRIGPALLAALAFGALVVGPLNSTLPVRAYFESRYPWDHFLGLILNRYLFVPTVFATNPVPFLVNSPLWSLRYEILCYAGVALLGMNRSRRWSASIVALFVASWLSFLVYREVGGDALPSVPETLSRLTACFSAGMLFYVFRARVPYRFEVAGAAALVCAGTFLAGGFRGAFPIAGGYLLLYVAFSPDIPLSRFGRYGDFSYGLYVFAYPIQQTVVRVLGSGVPVAVLFGISFLATLLLAATSWHLIEAPALSLKPRLATATRDPALRVLRAEETHQVIAVHAAGRNPSAVHVTPDC